jgi:hypothetical protein
MTDEVKHPNHYQSPGGLECLEVMDSLGIGIGYRQTNALKYLWRAIMGSKEGSSVKRDLEKAHEVIRQLIIIEEAREIEAELDRQGAIEAMAEAAETDITYSLDSMMAQIDKLDQPDMPPLGGHIKGEPSFPPWSPATHPDVIRAYEEWKASGVYQYPSCSSCRHYALDISEEPCWSCREGRPMERWEPAFPWSPATHPDVEALIQAYEGLKATGVYQYPSPAPEVDRNPGGSFGRYTEATEDLPPADHDRCCPTCLHVEVVDGFERAPCLGCREVTDGRVVFLNWEDGDCDFGPCIPDDEPEVFLACPFCGEDDDLYVKREVSPGSPVTWYVQCAVCGARGPFQPDTDDAMDDAVEAWDNAYRQADMEEAANECQRLLDLIEAQDGQLQRLIGGDS